MRTFNGIPRDAVAFAAGIHSVTGRTWVEIASALSLLGWGVINPEALGRAVGDFGIERVDIALRKNRSAVLVVRKDPSGGYTQ